MIDSNFAQVHNFADIARAILITVLCLDSLKMIKAVCVFITRQPCQNS